MGIFSLLPIAFLLPSVVLANRGNGVSAGIYILFIEADGATPGKRSHF